MLGSRVTRLVYALALLLAFHPSFAAQKVLPRGPIQPVPRGTLAPTIRRPLSSLPNGDIQELDFGHFFGNVERTLCVLVDDRIVEIHDPRVFDIESLEVTLAGVSSAVALPEDRPGNLAELFAADGSGLKLIPGALSWLFQAPGLVQGGSWVEAEALQVFDDGGVDTILGLSSDRLTLLSLVNSGGWIPGPSLDFGEIIEDLQALDFDADGESELAVLTFYGVAVVELDGTEIDFFPSVGTDVGAIEAISGPGADLLAWATLDSELEPILRVDGMSGSEAPLRLSFPIVEGQSPVLVDVAEMTGGDCNADGLDDLVLSDFASHRAVLLVNQGIPLAHFAANDLGSDHFLLHLALPAAEPGQENDCQPLIDDIDGDGQGDIAFGLDSTNEIVIFTNIPLSSVPAVIEAQINDPLVSATTYFNVANCEPPDTSSSCTEGELNMAFNLTQQLVDDFDYVQIAVWHQPAEYAALEPLSVSHTLHPFYGSPPRDPHQWIKVSIPEIWVVWPDTENYFIRYRFVRANINLQPPKILGGSPSFFSAFTLRHTGSHGDPLYLWEFDYLESLSLSNYGFLLLASPFPDSSSSSGLLSGRHTRRVTGAPLFLGNNFVGALYTKVVPPQTGEGLEVLPLVLISGAQIPW